MSRRRVYSQATKDIMTRFFSAIEACIQNKLVKNLATFCEDNQIDRRHFYTQRKDLDRGFFEVGWLVPLVRDYGVSSQWLLKGKGTMFAQ